MEDENVFVDVCGGEEDGGINEEDKENAGGQWQIGNPAMVISQRKTAFQGFPFTNAAAGVNASTPPISKTISSTEIDESQAEESEEVQSQEGKEGGGNRKSGGVKSTPRKEKSLGKLCGPFLARVGAEAAEGRDVHLETIARSMNVEKRRIYDIVNVMEALEVMQKTNKSFYKWHGLGQLPMLMEALQSEAKKGQLPRRIADAEEAMCRFAEFVGKINGNNDHHQLAPEEARPSTGRTTTQAGMENEEEEEEVKDPAFGPLANRERCGKNSLAQLCRRFLMVLLCNPERRRVSLDVVSTLLINNNEPGMDNNFEPPSRSRCRRLYDIANVLVEMRLVQKRNSMFGTKKIPLFEYCGPEPTGDTEIAARGMREFQERTGLMPVPIPTIKVEKSAGTKIAEIPADEENKMPLAQGGEGNKQTLKTTTPMDEEEKMSRKRKRQSKCTSPPSPSSSSQFGVGQQQINENIKAEPSSSIPSQNGVPSLKKFKRRILGEQNGGGQQQQHPSSSSPQQSTTALPRPKPLMPLPLPPPLPSAFPFSSPIAGLFSSFPSMASSILPPPPPPPPLPSSSFCWPPPSSAHHHLATLVAAHQQQQQQQLMSNSAFHSPLPIPPPPPSITTPSSSSSTPSIIRHSVQSILGPSQRENIQTPPSALPPMSIGNKQQQFGKHSPKAFKRPNKSAEINAGGHQHQQPTIRTLPLGQRNK